MEIYQEVNKKIGAKQNLFDARNFAALSSYKTTASFSLKTMLKFENICKIMQSIIHYL